MNDLHTTSSSRGYSDGYIGRISFESSSSYRSAYRLGQKHGLEHAEEHGSACRCLDFSEPPVCEGHPADDDPEHYPHAAIGEIVYCDGGCIA